MNNYQLSVKAYCDELNLEVVYSGDDLDKRYIITSEISRPGLIFTGFTEHFNAARVQIIGLMEHTYLDKLSEDARKAAIDMFMSKLPVAVVICRGLPLYDYMLDAAKLFGVPILRTNTKTSEFMSASISFLNVQLAPMMVQHGELLEIFGLGVMILGNSGIGKSETAIELINRGHRLVADDTIELRRVSEKTIVGNAPENIRHFMELRGIGIVNIRQLYGMGAVAASERVDLIINLENWDPEKNYSKIGMIDENMDILGNSIPSITIPVRPGRNLAVIIEVAVKNFRNKQMGYNAEDDLLKALGYTDDLI